MDEKSLHEAKLLWSRSPDDQVFDACHDIDNYDESVRPIILAEAELRKKSHDSVPITHKIKLFFDGTGGVSNYGDETQTIIKNFKRVLDDILRESGIDVEWVNTFDDTCTAIVKFVEIDTGNVFVRSCIGLLPIIGNFCGPAAKFVIEVQWTEGGHHDSKQYEEQENKASMGTESCLMMASAMVAGQFAQDLKRITMN